MNKKNDTFFKINIENTLHILLRKGVKKNGYFTVRLTVRGEGSATSALTVSKCENFDFFSLKLDSLTLKTHFISFGRVSKMHFSCPFLGCQNEGPAPANDHPEGSSSKRRNAGFQKLLEN